MTTNTAPVIIAPSMLVAGSVKTTPEIRAYLQARADRIRTITGETGPQRVGISVEDARGARLGDLYWEI